MKDFSTISGKAYVDIEKARAITGWMLDSELEWLAKQALTHSSIVEIGSFKGRSTRALGDHTPGIVYAIDHWHGPREVEMSDMDRAVLWREFYENLADLIAAGRVVPVRMDHAEADIISRGHRWQAPDMVFIDGDHATANVKHDIEVWRAHLRPGGLLCGHDWSWRSVQLAVEEMLPRFEVVEGTDIWRAL